MASELICETCGLSVPPDTAVCPRDGTVMLTSFHVPAPEPKVVVNTSPPYPDTGNRDPLIGLKLGEYELRSRIGVGGMGLVYEGIQPLIGKRVAVKVLRPELAHSTEQVERLLAEARAVNAIRHRGIIDIFGFGQVPDGRQYIIMEYLDGQALDTVLAEKVKLPVQESLSILDEVLAALAAAHGAGVVHRDLKPSNIFLVRQPDGSRYVKVLDFGLAKRAQTPTGRSAQTRTDMVVGTPEYMAPEQARGQEVGPMTDLYALGVVTFEMVTGRLPFVGSSPVDLLMKHVEARPPRPSEFVADLPPALDAFILQMLTKDPETRPNSADALRQQLNKLRRTLRATRTNPSAPAPQPPKPRAVDDASSRRPTTPVPVPPEVQGSEPSAQELKAAGIGAPAQKRLAVAGGIGVAVLLLAGGVAVISRGPGAPPLPVQAPATQPAATAPTAPGTDAPGTATAPTAPDTAAQPAAMAVAAPGTAAIAAQPAAAAAPAQDSATPATAPAAAPGTTASVKKASIRTRRADVDTDAAPSDEPLDVDTVANPSAIQRRIDFLEEELSTLSVEGKLDDAQTGAAQALLDRCRRQARRARTSEQRRELNDKLDYFERVYLKK